MRIFLLTNLIGITLFFAACGNDVRPDAYVSQPSMLLTKDNIAHSRITLSGDRLGKITFDKLRFEYRSEVTSLEGTWESELVDIVSKGDDVSVVSSIDYSGDDGSEYHTYFVSNDFSLNIGDTFILTGDQILSGTVVRIERQNIY